MGKGTFKMCQHIWDVSNQGLFLYLMPDGTLSTINTTVEEVTKHESNEFEPKWKENTEMIEFTSKKLG